MSTTTPRLGLISPAGTDQFERADFVSNYAILDQYPGTFVCTSTTRPHWTSAQLGQLILETDTKRMMEWDGSSFHEVQSAPSAWMRSIDPSISTSGPISLSSHQSLQFTIGTISLRRPASIAMLVNCNIKQMRYQSFSASFTPLIDNGYVGPYTGTGAEVSQWHTFGTEGNWNDYRVIPGFGMKSVGAGNHSLGIRMTTQQGTGSLLKASVLAFMVNSSDV